MASIVDMNRPFQIGDTFIHTVTGEEYFIEKVDRYYCTNAPVIEDYTLFNIKSGKRHAVSGPLPPYYTYVSVNDATPLPQGLHQYIGIDPAYPPCHSEIKQIEVDSNEIHKSVNSPEYRFDEYRSCQHDWVTWTGLHGTVTDCSKCKTVREDG